MNAIGYIRVSSQDQANTGLGVAAQERAITDYAAAKGVTLVRIERDIAKSAKAMDNRDGLIAAVNACKQGVADGIIIAKVDRLVRSMTDLHALMEQSRKEGWRLIPLDMAGMDLTTPVGEAMLTMMGAFAQLERRLIAERTKDALAELKAQGKQIGGPRTYSMHVRKLARQCYLYGWSVDQTVSAMRNMVSPAPSRATVARMMRDATVPMPKLAVRA